MYVIKYIYIFSDDRSGKTFIYYCFVVLKILICSWRIDRWIFLILLRKFLLIIFHSPKLLSNNNNQKVVHMLLPESLQTICADIEFFIITVKRGVQPKRNSVSCIIWISYILYSSRSWSHNYFIRFNYTFDVLKLAWWVPLSIPRTNST